MVSMTESPTRDYLVYCLQSTVTPTRTYVGVTNNWTRRLRQHNGEITGGAKTTRAHRPWKGIIHVTGLTQTEALQLEWAWKHRRKGGAGPRGRVTTLAFLFGLEKWTNRAPLVKDLELQCETCLSEQEYCALGSVPIIGMTFDCELR